MRWTLLLGLLLPLVLSCTSAKRSPVAPDVAATAVDPTTLAFAAADLVIDADSAQVQVDQRTVAAAGEALTIDLSTFMRAEQCLRIDGIRRIDPDTIGLTISIRHPIPMPPEGEEPKFHATDVLGIFLFDGVQGKQFLSQRAHAGWVEAAGYTNLLNPSLLVDWSTTANQHPYVLLSEDTRVPNYDPADSRGWIDVRNPKGYNVLPQGSDWRSTEARLHLPSGQHRVRLAIQGNLQSVPLFDGAGTPLPARYCYPEGSLQSAWKIETEIWNDGMIAGDPTSRCDVLVRVWDWQHNAEIANPWSEITTKAAVRQPSDAMAFDAYFPGFANEVLTGHWSEGSEIGAPQVFVFSLFNSPDNPPGEYPGLLVVQDDRVPTGLVDHDGVPFAHTISYWTCQTMTLTVHPAGTPRPVALQVANDDRFFLAADESRVLESSIRMSDGSLVPLGTSPVTHRLPAEYNQGGATLIGPSILQRTLPGDQSETGVLESVVESLRLRAWTTFTMGEPFADAIDANLVNCGASGIEQLPALALGGPRGSGAGAGNSDHIVSLGYSGSLTLKMADGGILDKPGPDFIVFENAFEIGQNPDEIFTETVKVEVSADGNTWFAFPMDYRPNGPLPWRNPANFSGMAGVTPVLANVDENTIDPTDPAVAGGDAFDLAVVGLAWADHIRLTATGIDSSSPCFAGCPFNTRMTDADGDLIDDEGKHGTCSGSVGGPDIDAVAIVKGHQGFPEQ